MRSPRQVAEVGRAFKEAKDEVSRDDGATGCQAAETQCPLRWDGDSRCYCLLADTLLMEELSPAQGCTLCTPHCHLSTQYSLHITLCHLSLWYQQCTPSCCSAGCTYPPPPPPGTGVVPPHITHACRTASSPASTPHHKDPRATPPRGTGCEHPTVTPHTWRTPCCHPPRSTACAHPCCLWQYR